MSSKLTQLEVLVLDTQTTGPSPGRGHLLELAWTRTTASRAERGDFRLKSHLVALPKGASIPRRITSLTGINEDMLHDAAKPDAIWSSLTTDIEKARNGNPHRKPIAVIHYSRFEEPFLRELATSHGNGDGLPFDLVCTHQIAKGLLPDLPRRGLKALAGYFGHVMGELKRAGAHVSATALVWSELVAALEERLGIAEIEDMRAWLDEAATSSTPRRSGPRAYPMPRDQRLGLPDSPGIYRMLALGGAVLYVGKASSLSRRVNSYFQKRKHPKAERTLELLTQVRDVEVTVTGSALEAAMLESDEIKRLSPPYNKALRGTESDVWFADAEALSTETTPSDSHPLGPLPSARSLLALGHLRSALVASGRRRRLNGFPLSLMLGLPDGLQANVTNEVFFAGLEHLSHELGLTPDPDQTLAPLIRAGAKLWRNHHRAREDELEPTGTSSTSADESDDLPSRRELMSSPWDAERVTSALESVVMRETYLLRRAHALTRLTQACIVFRPKGSTPSTRRRIVIDRGRISAAAGCGKDDMVEVPPGWQRSPFERRSCFDTATYDRLRVLLTELRRLISDEAPVTLSLDERPPLANDALARWLRWV